MSASPPVSHPPAWSEAVRNLLWWLARWVLFRFDAERAHHATLAMVRLVRAPVLLRLVSGSRPFRIEDRGIPALGMDFQSRVGLAAGFDKNAEILPLLPHLGFGFAEIGTVTPRPQPGNERPRLFRDPSRQALFNRMGFNNLGASIVAERLRRARASLPPNFRVGVNVGKNKDTPNEEAVRDYVEAARPFRGLADYLVVNVSSPNTPGLRSLQTVESLRPIIESVVALISEWEHRPPLLLKLAPELTEEELRAIVTGLEGNGIDGWIVTNTLGGSLDSAASGKKIALTGGWSGKPLTVRSKDVLLLLRSMTRLPIISVGGIMDAEEAKARIEAGADLIQLYSGWIYGGPGLPTRIASALRK